MRVASSGGRIKNSRGAGTAVSGMCVLTASLLFVRLLFCLFSTSCGQDARLVCEGPETRRQASAFSGGLTGSANDHGLTGIHKWERQGCQWGSRGSLALLLNPCAVLRFMPQRCAEPCSIHSRVWLLTFNLIKIK